MKPTVDDIYAKVVKVARQLHRQAWVAAEKDFKKQVLEVIKPHATEAELNEIEKLLAGRIKNLTKSELAQGISQRFEQDLLVGLSSTAFIQRVQTESVNGI